MRSLKTTIFLLLSLFASTVHALNPFGGGAELLEQTAAFATDVALDSNETPVVNVTINVAEGYFLYRQKLSLSSEQAEFGELQLPDGITKQDEFFGEVETYRGLLLFSAPVTAKVFDKPLELTVHSQGCADIGVCYPPHEEKFLITVDASLVNDVAPLVPKSQGTLSNFLKDDSDDEVLDPEIAFTMEPVQTANGVATLRWNIRDRYYLYRDRFSFEILTPENTTVGNVVLGEADISRGKIKEDQFFGEVEVLRDFASVKLPVEIPDNENVTLKVGYQGCADIGICYPPIFKELNLTGGNASAATLQTTNTTATNITANLSTESTAAPIAEQDRLASQLQGKNRWATILTFFGLGLLLTFTPCVLPMIPILSSIIVGSGDTTSGWRAFSLSLVYVLAMALTYTVAGVLVGLSGDNIQATLQHPVVLSSIAALFVVLSASMFGFFELQMPTFIQNRLTNVSNQQKGGSFTGVATMGFLSALIVGPCVTAPLVGALIYIAQTGDAVLGGAALFALSMGMGIPVLLIGTAFGKYLPRAGVWMETTKAIFGFMLLGLAIYMLDRVVPHYITMFLSALLLIGFGIYLKVFNSLPADASSWLRVGKGLGYACVVYATLLIVGVSTGSGTVFKPLQGLTTASNQSTHIEFQQVKGLEELNHALAVAKSQNKPVMFDFYADWCISCKEMEAFTFTNPAVEAKLSQAVLLQADVTANDDADKELLKAFGIFGPPAIIFYDNTGVEQSNSRVVGFMAAEEFSSVLNRIY